MSLLMLLIPLLAGVSFLLGFAVKRLISEFRTHGNINPKYTKQIIISLFGILFFCCLYLLLNAALSHSQVEKSLLKWKCLFAFSSIVLLPSALLFILRDYCFEKHHGMSRWKRKSITIVACMAMLLIFSAARSGAWPPLSWAIRNGWTNIAHLLIKTQVSINEIDAYGISPLEYAVVANDRTTIKLLIKNGAQIHGNSHPGASSLWQACVRGYRDTAELLIDKGVDVNTIFDFGFYAGWTPLMVAAERGHLDIVKMLVEKGANAGTCNEQGNTAAGIASKNGHKEVLEFLDATEKGGGV